MERATVTTSSFTKKQGFSSHRDYNRRSAWIWQRTSNYCWRNLSYRISDCIHHPL